MTVQLASGAFDELATQNRYLDLKYDGGGVPEGWSEARWGRSLNQRIEGPAWAILSDP